MLRHLRGEASVVVKTAHEDSIEYHRAQIQQRVQETQQLQKEALKVQILGEEMQKEVRRLVYTMNGQRNLTKLQLSTNDFIQNLDFLTEEQKITMVNAQSKAD